MLTATVPVAAAGLFRQWIDQQKALQRFARNDEALDSLEIAARLLFRVGCRPGRQRFEKAVATGARVTCGAASVSLTRAGEDGENASPEDLEVEGRLLRRGGGLLRAQRWPHRKEKRQNDQRRF